MTTVEKITKKSQSAFYRFETHFKLVLHLKPVARAEGLVDLSTV